jgi:hypothetical protein
VSNAKTIVVFTAKSITRIRREGGSGNWHLKVARARQCEYVVCARNAHASWVEGREPHRTAFLVGRIREIVPVPVTPENQTAKEQNRWRIECSEYALIDVPNLWQRNRNPVKYSTLSELGIDPGKLDWKAMPKSGDGKDRTVRNGTAPLRSIMEAKKELALLFNVLPEAIEISIRV